MGSCAFLQGRFLLPVQVEIPDTGSPVPSLSNDNNDQFIPRRSHGRQKRAAVPDHPAIL